MQIKKRTLFNIIVVSLMIGAPFVVQKMIFSDQSRFRSLGCVQGSSIPQGCWISKSDGSRILITSTRLEGEVTTGDLVDSRNFIDNNGARICLVLYENGTVNVQNC